MSFKFFKQIILFISSIVIKKLEELFVFKIIKIIIFENEVL
jgi:hypothetical protein